MSNTARRPRSPRSRPLTRADRAALFTALGDPTRLALVDTLADGTPQSIARLSAGSTLTRQAITKHLRVLEEAGVVRGTRVGRESRYALDTEPLTDAREYLERVSTRWDEALARLKQLVEEG